MEKLEHWNLAIDVDTVLRGQGADPALVRQRRPRLVAVAERALAEGLPLIEPRVALQRWDVSGLRHERLMLENHAALGGLLVARHLAPATRIAVLVCTIGEQLEWLTSQILQEDATLGLALDGLGSMAVERLATEACKRLEDEAAIARLYTSIPLSPGMIGWPLDSGQRDLFALIDAHPAGVTLEPSAQMLPRKSLSMVLGFGPQPFSAGRTCDYCMMRATCRYQDHYARPGTD